MKKVAILSYEGCWGMGVFSATDFFRIVALLEQHLPGFSTHPQLAMAKSMSLATVAKFSGGMITDELLQKVDAALKAL